MPPTGLPIDQDDYFWNEKPPNRLLHTCLIIDGRDMTALVMNVPAAIATGPGHQPSESAVARVIRLLKNGRFIG